MMTSRDGRMGRGEHSAGRVTITLTSWHRRGKNCSPGARTSRSSSNAPSASGDRIRIAEPLPLFRNNQAGIQRREKQHESGKEHVMPYRVQSHCAGCGNGDAFEIGYWTRDLGVHVCQRAQSVVNVPVDTGLCPGCGEPVDAADLYDYSFAIPYSGGQSPRPLEAGPTCPSITSIFTCRPARLRPGGSRFRSSSTSGRTCGRCGCASRIASRAHHIARRRPPTIRRRADCVVDASRAATGQNPAKWRAALEADPSVSDSPWRVDSGICQPGRGLRA